jgi:hypothetical protein
MTPSPPPTASVHRRTAAAPAGTTSRRRRAHRQERREEELAQRVLGRYTDPQNRAREVLARPATAGSVLVLDRDIATRADMRLVAHLAPDEPAENAELVCASYFADVARGRCRCRRLTSQDLNSVPFAEAPHPLATRGSPTRPAWPVDRCGYSYRLEPAQTGMSIPELRWWRRHPSCATDHGRIVSMREAIAAIESYEPMCALTVLALSRHDVDGAISTTVLRAELTRVQRSPIVLNRRLREVVLGIVQRDGLSISEIAIRCDRIKRDHRGNESGETSWLARRLGLLPEGGQSTPTPWIHSDVLALIARDGLGVSPREVEL